MAKQKEGKNAAYITAKAIMDAVPTTLIVAGRIEPNTGQIEGLPENPRLIKSAAYVKLRKSLKQTPQMLYLRELIVVEHGDKYVLIGGNMRYRAAVELGFTELPCKVLPAGTPVEYLREITIKDNSHYGEFDFEMLANDWDASLLGDWAVNVADLERTLEESLAAVDDAEGGAGTAGGAMGDANRAVTDRAKQAKEEGKWATAEQAGGDVCSMRIEPRIVTAAGRMWVAIWGIDAEGIPVGELMQKRNADTLGITASGVVQQLIGSLYGGGWCVVPYPHTDKAVADLNRAAAKELAKRMGVPLSGGLKMVEGVLTAEVEALKKDNAIVYAAALTTDMQNVPVGERANFMLLAGLNTIKP